jgi:P4 family phage/plasmid primase-like protien
MLRRFCKLKGKVPFEKNWPSNGYKIEDLDGWNGPIGLLIPKGFVCVDIDNREDADKIEAIVTGCAVHQTPRGLHLIYKLPENKKIKIQNWAGKSVFLGFDVDFRISGGQIVYPTFQEDRKIVVEFTGDEIELPEIFWPLTYNLSTNYIQLSEGGRDSGLTEHYGRLLRYDCDAAEIIHATNSLLDAPLDPDQVDKIIGSINKKESKKKKEKDPWLSGEEDDDYDDYWYYDGKLIPHRLAEHIAKEKNIIYHNELWYMYDDGIWGLTTENYIGRYIRSFLTKPRMIQINEVLGQLRILCVDDYVQFNRDPELIIFENCAYKRGEVLEFDKDHYATMRVEANYDPNAKAPKVWFDFLASSIGDKKSIACLQEMLGYLLPINLLGKAFFVLHGPTDCGKSVISELIGTMIGRSKVSNVSIQALCDTNNRWAAGELYNQSVNINTDISSKVLRDTSILKQFTGDGFLRYEKKGSNAFSGPVTCRLVFVANALPPTTDHSDAFYNRLKIINFPESIIEGAQDKRLIFKLKSELPGIINWALEGLERLIENNYRFTEDREKKDEYKEYSNNVLQFVKEHCEWDLEAEEGSSDIYNLYKFFCKENGYIKFSQKNFISELLATGKCALRRTSKQRLIKGLKIVYRPEINIKI